MRETKQRRTKRLGLSAIFRALKQGETIAKELKIKRPRISEAIPMLKQGSCVRPKPIEVYKNLVCK